VSIGDEEKESRDTYLFGPNKIAFILPENENNFCVIQVTVDIEFIQKLIITKKNTLST